MTDIVDTSTRSQMMSGIRGRNTKPEIQVRRLLHRRGFRFRLHVYTLPGKPDIVLPKYHAVIFVHGCFWHGHGCHLFKWPSSRPEWWRNKIEGTLTHDARIKANLTALGWRQACVWECALKGKYRQSSEDIADILSKWLGSDQKILEVAGRTA